jgi:hypothetical protein
MLIKIKALNQFVEWKTAVLAALAIASLTSTPALAGQNDNDENEFRFDLVRSPALNTTASPNFVPNAHGRVKIESVGPVEIMDVIVWGLPPDTDFDFFVIQIPHAPFGLAWYQGDIETNRYGVGHERFIGRFNIETFIVSQPPGNVASPIVFDNMPPTGFPDGTPGPETEPIHTYHLGLWFNSPQDAAKAGGPSTVTRFNGEHNAGVQVLNTQTDLFPDEFGPLRHVK